MKSLFPRISVILGLVLFATLAKAQTAALTDTTTVDRKKKVEMATQETLDKVLKYAVQRKYDSFGKLMAYTGRDPNRTMRSAMNPGDPHEKLEIENTCNYLHHIQEKMALYQAQNFRTVKGAAGDLYFWDAEFTLLNGKSKKYSFLFIELDGKYYFCRVDKV